MADTYQCDHCGGEFEKGWTDEEAEAECKSEFGIGSKDQSCAILCDDCYNRFIAWFRSQRINN